MASTFIIMGNKLKLMIEQTKIHAEALKDSAVTQAKIQAENEKAEVQNIIFILIRNRFPFENKLLLIIFNGFLMDYFM